MKKLHFYQTNENDILAHPAANQDIRLDTPALHFFNDFLQIKPIAIKDKTLAVEAMQLMFKANVKLQLVVDKDENFVGIASINELSDIKLIQLTSQGYDRHEILVSELMIPKHKLLAFDYSELKSATIEDVINALKASGQHHCLVIDRETHLIRGLFSARDISQKLHLTINITDQTSFYKCIAAVKS